MLEALAKLLEEHGWKVERPGTEPAEPEKPKCVHRNFSKYHDPRGYGVQWVCDDCGETDFVRVTSP